MKKVLITGTKGFLGSNVAAHFKALGFITYGLGHGKLSSEEALQIGLDCWQEGQISIAAILAFKQNFDVIIHCGGSGSVGFSVAHPYDDFKKTVNGTLEVLEYIRAHNPNAQLIYPSSPAVQGECEDNPIKEEYLGKPVSPYGYHKKITEDLCKSYSEKYSLKISIVRLFSVYGIGLKKQLLWDACNKIKNNPSEVIFWGTGKETRDFIHINDVLRLFEFLLEKRENFIIINGGTGKKHTIKSVVEMVRDAINPAVKVKFNNEINIGNPIYYQADTEKLQNYGFKTKISLEQGIIDYIQWAKNIND